ncbi:MAG TPA: hypothetical protein H9869_01685 [Candidatus Ligilactobacillus excrementipullorum]|nr:hypothetical protein [Candidatus Ligilactobacillus excrementipullorum]
MRENNKRVRQLFLFGLVFILTLVTWQSAQMAETPPKKDQVLLVYDSKNEEVHGAQKLASVQRMLSSLGLASQPVRASDYRQGQLNDRQYGGTILLVNWPQAQLVKQSYLNDLQDFSGVQLQIGGQLAASQLRQMNVQQKRIYQQQLTLKAGQATQQLPFASSVNVLTDLPTNARQFGTLIPQSNQQEPLAFGVSVGRRAYLPWFEGSGIMSVQTATMLGELFNRKTTTQPLLTITGINPYSNLRVLDDLTKKLQKQGAPFALSVSTVSNGTREAAFYKYTAILRRAQQRGGIIFMHVPYARQLTVKTQEELVNAIQDSVVSLGQAGVYPVGYSSPQFWQQNHFLRTTGTASADTLLLLPNPQRQKLQAVMQDRSLSQKTGQVNQAFYASSQSDLQTVKHQEALQFTSPTALTVKMPATQKQSKQLLRDVDRLDFQWFDPAQAQLQTQIKVGSVSFSYQGGRYFVNGRQVKVSGKLPQRLVARKADRTSSKLDRFFELGSTFLIVVFIIVLLLLIILLLMGRQVYYEMFKHHDDA